MKSKRFSFYYVDCNIVYLINNELIYRSFIDAFDVILVSSGNEFYDVLVAVFRAPM